MPIPMEKWMKGLLGEERFEKMKEYEIGIGEKKINAYKFLADSYALNTYSYPPAAFFEMGLGNMDVGEHLRTRFFGIFTNAIFSRPYSKWRNFMLEKLKVREDSHWTKKYPLKYLVDTAIFVPIQIPIFWLNTWLGGAEWNETLRATGGVIPSAAALGWLYGIYLEWTYKRWDIPLDYLEESKSSK